MNETNLIPFLIKVIAEQKAAAPAASGQAILIWTMVSNTVLTPLVTAFVVYLNKKSQDIKLDKQAEKLDQQAKVLEDQTAVLDEQTAITKEIKTDVNSERSAMVKTVSDLRDEILKISKEKTVLEERHTENGKSAAAAASAVPASEIAELKKMLGTMSEEIALLKGGKA